MKKKGINYYNTFICVNENVLENNFITIYLQVYHINYKLFLKLLF